MFMELLIAIGFFAILHTVGAAFAIAQRDRIFLAAWVFACLVASVVLLWIMPVLGILALVCWFFVIKYGSSLFNLLVLLNQNAQLGLADAQAAQFRRNSVIPRIEAWARAYSGWEAETLVRAIHARGTRAANLIALAERYPTLQASQPFLNLIAELVDSENRILTARVRYNDAAKNYNTKGAQFPELLFARALGFNPLGYLVGA